MASNTSWVARDKNGLLTLFEAKPRWSDRFHEWIFGDEERSYARLPKKLCPDLKPGECARVVGIVLEKEGEGNG